MDEASAIYTLLDSFSQSFWQGSLLVCASYSANESVDLWFMIYHERDEERKGR